MAAFASSLSSTGFQKLPSGLIIQWGIEMCIRDSDKVLHAQAPSAAAAFSGVLPGAEQPAVDGPEQQPEDVYKRQGGANTRDHCVKMG